MCQCGNGSYGICKECGTKDQYGNFCSNCRAQLKMKCPECGNMECIDRKVCCTRIKKICEEKSEYVKTNTRISFFGYSVLSFVAYFLSLTLFVILISDFHILPQNFSSAIIASVFSCGSLFLIETFGMHHIEKVGKKFWQLHPDYAELMRQYRE